MTNIDNVNHFSGKLNGQFEFKGNYAYNKSKMALK